LIKDSHHFFIVKFHSFFRHKGSDKSYIRTILIVSRRPTTTFVKQVTLDTSTFWNETRISCTYW